MVNSLSRANSVAAQNIVLGSPNQVLGGFQMNVTGEPLQVASQVYHFNWNSNAASSNLLTNVSLVDSNGLVVAGPQNGVSNGGTEQTVTFGSTVTFPTGSHVYTLKGQLPTTVSNGQTLIASTTVSSDWGATTGQITGNTISLTGLTSVVSGNTMTVRSGTVALSVSPSPASQTIVSGQSQMNVGNIVFDGTQSGEDVRFNTVKFTYDADALVTKLTNCNIYDGTNQLNSSAVTLSGAYNGSAIEQTFTLSSPLIVSKGTTKTVAIDCDVPGSLSSGNFSWGIAVQPGTSSDTFSGTGVSSSQTIYPSASVNTGQTSNLLTITGSGTLSVALDAVSPAYAIAAAGSTGVTLSSLRFTGTNEPMRLDRVALQMSNTSASSSPGNLVQVTLWDGNTQVGTAIFANSRFATSTLTSTVTIPANGFKTLTVKGDLSGISLSSAGTEGALLQVDYDNGDSTGTRAIGASSGATINRTSSADSAAAGVRVFKSFPVVQKLAAPSLTLVPQNGSELFRFQVTANLAGDVGVQQFTINVATSTGSAANGTTTVGNLKIYAYTDAALSQGVPGFTSGLISNTFTGGIVSNGNSKMVVDQSSQTKLEIPAGSTYYFKVVGDVAQTAGSTNSAGTVTTKLTGDSDYPDLANTILMSTASAIDGDAHNSAFVWSPNATTTSSTSANDWTNGYGVSGLPSNGLDATTLTKSS